MQNLTVKLLVLTALASGLSACTEKPAAPTKMACINDITAVDIRDSGKDKGRASSPFIDLLAVKPGPTMIAYGPARNPKAEITIIDGKYYLTRPQGAGTTTATNPKQGQNAVFLITSEPDVWMHGGALGAAEGLDALSTVIGERASALGCGGAAVFPFKITGRASALTWSITGSPTGMKGEITDADITIVGVYDNSGTERNAMMSGLNIHPHFYSKTEKLSGHLNAVVLDAGAMLYVPGVVEDIN